MSALRAASRSDVYQHALDGLDTQPGYLISHPCHPACATDCDECERVLAERRSEAVGAEFEQPTAPFAGLVDRWDPRPLALLIVSITIVVLLVLLDIHLAARWHS